MYNIIMKINLRSILAFLIYSLVYNKMTLFKLRERLTCCHYELHVFFLLPLFLNKLLTLLPIFPHKSESNNFFLPLILSVISY